MRYLPKSPAEREQMLKAIGAQGNRRSVCHYSGRVPARARSRCAAPAGRERNHRLLQGGGEQECHGLCELSGRGRYRHYRPVIIDALVQRGEFLTSYTPYQPEITQGTLQAIFEFQTMIAELTGMDVANASMYDGSTGAAEAVLMAMRVTGRHKAVVARTVHPEYREVLHTYLQFRDLPTTDSRLRRRDGPRGSRGAGCCGDRRDGGGAGAEPELLWRH